MKYLKSIGIMSLIIIVSIFLITLLNYFDVLNKNIVSIVKLLLIIITLFLGGFSIGQKSYKKGWIEGLKLGTFFIILIFILNILLFKNTFEIKNLYYYLILIVSSIFGSMLGINKNNNKT